MYRYLLTAAYKKQIMEEVKIIQHNVLHWTRERAIELSNYYRTMNADIVLLNSTSTFDTERIHIYNYSVIQRNASTERNAGVAIAIKSNIKYRPIDDFVDDILGIEIDTTKGPISVLTCYCPLQRGYIPTGELENKLQLPRPVYVIGDMNVNMPFMGYRQYNNNGRILKRLIETNKI